MLHHFVLEAAPLMAYNYNWRSKLPNDLFQDFRSMFSTRTGHDIEPEITTAVALCSENVIMISPPFSIKSSAVNYFVWISYMQCGLHWPWYLINTVGNKK